MKEYDLTDLCAAVAEKITFQDPENWPQPKYVAADVREVLSTAFSMIADGLVEAGGRVELHELGTFRLEARDADSGTLPNGGHWETPARNKVVFRPAPLMLRIIAERTGMPAY